MSLICEQMFLDNIQSQSDDTLKTAQRLIRVQLAYRKKYAKQIALEKELAFNNPLKNKIVLTAVKA